MVAQWRYEATDDGATDRNPKPHQDFPGVRALDDVSMSVEAGEIRALLGENGAGKSTLGKIVAGVYARDQGTVLVDGADIGAYRREGGGRPRHRHRASGRVAGAAAVGRREHLRRSAADALARAGRHVARCATRRKADRPNLASRSTRPARSSALSPGAGADRRDRQGPVARPAHPDPRRTDRRADADRDREAVRCRPNAGRDGVSDHLRLAPAGRDFRALPVGHSAQGRSARRHPRGGRDIDRRADPPDGRPRGSSARDGVRPPDRRQSCWRPAASARRPSCDRPR